MYYIKIFIIVSLVISILGYILSVLREKYYLKRNIILMDNKNISQKDLEGLDMNTFIYKELYLKTGDEIKIKTNNETYKGTLLGGKFNEGVIRIITKSNHILEIQLNKVSKMKITKKYGKFFVS